MSSDLMSCPECRWYECEGVNPYCTHPAVANSTGDLYPLKWDNTTCGRFDAIEAVPSMPSAKSCYTCKWHVHGIDLFCTHPNYANVIDILKTHVNKQTGCSSFASAEEDDSKATCSDCGWYAKTGEFCNRRKNTPHFTKPDKTACIEHYKPKSAASKANCGQCFWFDPTKEFCSEQAIHQIEFFITSDTVVCDHFFEPVDPEHVCGECEYFHAMSTFEAVCKNKKISKIYKKEDLAGHLACKKNFKPKEKVHTCGECYWYDVDQTYCAEHLFHNRLPAVFACEDFKTKKKKVEDPLGLKPALEPFWDLLTKKKSKNTCAQCYFYEEKIDGPTTTQHCKRKNSFAFVDDKSCKEFKPKAKKIISKRTCGQCHFISDIKHGFVDDYECMHDEIPNIVSKDLDATKCSSFAPIVKAKDGSICHSCQWITDSKEHCTYRTEPGADFPKGDKCAFHALQLMGFKNTKEEKADGILLENPIPSDLAVKLGCAGCKHHFEGYCKSSVQHKIISKGTPFVVCEEYAKKEPNTQQMLKMKIKPEFANMLKNFQKMENKKKAAEEPLEQLVEHVCKKCEHFGVLTNGKSICGTEDTPQLYTEADQTACKEHFKPKPLKTCKTAKPGQRKIKWK